MGNVRLASELQGFPVDRFPSIAPQGAASASNTGSAVTMILRDYTNPASDLIDPDFDLEPLPAGLREHGWQDKRSGLSFLWIVLRSEDFDGPRRQYILNVKHQKLPNKSMSFAKFTLVEKINHPHILVKYEVSRSEITERLPKIGRSEALQDDEIVAGLGGKDAFVDLCLKGARACHRVYAALSDHEAAVRDEANFVEFVLLP